jgi:hypothetical protein
MAAYNDEVPQFIPKSTQGRMASTADRELVVLMKEMVTSGKLVDQQLVKDPNDGVYKTMLFNVVTRHVGCTTLIGPEVKVSTRPDYLRCVLEGHVSASAYNKRPGAVFVLDLFDNLPRGTKDTVFGVYLYSLEGKLRCAVVNFYDPAHWIMRDLSRGLHLESFSNRIVLYDAESHYDGARGYAVLLIDVLKWYSSERASA